MLARDQWADKILNTRIRIGEGITGWAAEHREAVLTNRAHLDPARQDGPGDARGRARGDDLDPAVARGAIKGALNVYRLGESAAFDDDEFELAKRFGDAARSRSTTPRSRAPRSIRRRPTRSPASTTTATSTSGCARSSAARAGRTNRSRC